jgi:hypothetical protein
MMAVARTLAPNFPMPEHGLPFLQELLLVPGASILPFTNSPLGYDVVHPLASLWLALRMAVLPLVAEFLYVGVTARPLPPNIGHIPLLAFVALYVALSLAIFACRMWGEKSDKVHSASHGYSWLVYWTNLPVPLCEVVLVPAAVVALGWQLGGLSLELSWWLQAAGMSMAVRACWEWRNRRRQYRVARDELLRAERYSETVLNATGRGAGTGARTDDEFATMGQGGRREDARPGPSSQRGDDGGFAHVP